MWQSAAGPGGILQHADLLAARRQDDPPGLLVRFDGYALDAEEAECWVDEDGEDEWCWERKFKLYADGVVLPPLEQVRLQP